MREDPGIAWIRDVRHRISQEFNHDPRKLVNYYKELQKRHKNRLLRPEKDKSLALAGARASRKTKKK